MKMERNRIVLLTLSCIWVSEMVTWSFFDPRVLCPVWGRSAGGFPLYKEIKGPRERTRWEGCAQLPGPVPRKYPYVHCFAEQARWSAHTGIRQWAGGDVEA